MTEYEKARLKIYPENLKYIIGIIKEKERQN